MDQEELKNLQFALAIPVISTSLEISLDQHVAAKFEPMTRGDQGKTNRCVNLTTRRNVYSVDGSAVGATNCSWTVISVQPVPKCLRREFFSMQGKVPRSSSCAAQHFECLNCFRYPLRTWTPRVPKTGTSSLGTTNHELSSPLHT